jgi:hypothetical protein
MVLKPFLVENCSRANSSKASKWRLNFILETNISARLIELVDLKLGMHFGARTFRNYL